MFELLMVVCSLADQTCLAGASEPNRTAEVRLHFAAEYQNVTPMQCMRYGQPEMIKWLESHPGVRIVKWSCRPPQQQAKKA